MPLPFISIICPVYNEEKHIVHCVESILRQDYPKDLLEVFFIDGRSTDCTREIINNYIGQYAYIQLLDNPHYTAPYALNIGIRQAVGEYIIRLDGHSAYPDNYFSKLIHYVVELQADNVGGVIVTLPACETAKCKAIAIALSNRFGVGNSIFRVGATAITRVDTVPFGCFRKNIFTQIGLFDEELTRNQDDEFNARIIKYGGKIFLIPDLIITYTARDTLRKMSKMYEQYGLFKPLVNKKLGKPATLRQFFPTLFLCGLVGGAILSCFFPVVRLLYLLIIAVYFLLGLSIGFSKIKRHKDWKIAIYLPVTFFLLHISYGWGYLKGLYKIVIHAKFNVIANR